MLNQKNTPREEGVFLWKGAIIDVMTYLHGDTNETISSASFESEDLLLKLLSKRGFSSLEEAERFLNPRYEEDVHDPFLLPDMENISRQYQHIGISCIRSVTTKQL